MKLQQPRNYDFWMFQFNLLGSQGGNSREMTTSPPGHDWEVTVGLTTTAKLQQVRANNREMPSQKLNNRYGRSMRFRVASWLSSFQVPWGSLWKALSSPHRGISRFVAYTAADFCSESANQVKMHRIAKVIFCDAHRTAQIACCGPIWSRLQLSFFCLQLFWGAFKGSVQTFQVVACLQVLVSA